MRIDPLEAVALPAFGTSIGINAANSWLVETEAGASRLAYVATNSTQRLSLVSLQTAAANIRGVVSRSARSADYPYGVVVELLLDAELESSQTIYVSLAQAGATTYYPPQPISD